MQTILQSGFQCFHEDEVKYFENCNVPPNYCCCFFLISRMKTLAKTTLVLYRGKRELSWYRNLGWNLDSINYLAFMNLCFLLCKTWIITSALLTSSVLETSNETMDEKHFINCEMSCHVQRELRASTSVALMFICHLKEGESQRITGSKWLFFTCRYGFGRISGFWEQSLRKIVSYKCGRGGSFWRKVEGWHSLLSKGKQKGYRGAEGAVLQASYYRGLRAYSNWLFCRSSKPLSLNEGTEPKGGRWGRWSRVWEDRSGFISQLCVDLYHTACCGAVWPWENYLAYLLLGD